LASSLAMMGALLYPHAPRWLDVLGRAGFILTTTAYWWVLNVLSGSYTGILLYPLLFIGLALEAFPSFRRQPLFRSFVALVGVASSRAAHRGLEAAARAGLRGAGAAAGAGGRGLVPRPARHRGAGARGHGPHGCCRGGLPAALRGGRSRVPAHAAGLSGLPWG